MCGVHAVDKAFEAIVHNLRVAEVWHCERRRDR